jgi:AraC family transcriptional regulator, transcriptional activator of pobA
MGDMERKDIGHFNVFDIGQMFSTCKAKPGMPYNRRTYYKISAIHGNNVVEYADKVVNITDYGILFATPKIPYRYLPQDTDQKGHFCVFTKEFMTKSKTGMLLDELPIFQANTDFIFPLTKAQFEDINQIFNKMHLEIKSDYPYKYDLLRNFVTELIHYGQKLKPAPEHVTPQNAATRITSLFLELLERQFPVESATQVLLLRTPKDYADTLNVHVNHLNKVLKEGTGKTTSDIISSRVTQEAKILLRQTAWTVSEIAYTLGYEEIAHFSNFFKKQAGLSPMAYRT